MPCETLKDIAILGGIAIIVFLSIWATLVQNKMNILIKDHGISKIDFKNNLSNIPIEVMNQVTKLKHVSLLLLLAFVGCIAILFFITEKICPIS